MRSRYAPLLLALLGFALFAGIAFWRAQQPLSLEQPQVQDRVVIAAPILLALYGGDRFLAADLETMRLAATGIQDGQSDTNYLIRAQQVVAQLNGCHEDNYYLANGLLTWGGAVSEGSQVLRAAVQCRTWDFAPAFFYGINLAFFQRDIAEAQRILELGAQRSPENAAGLRKLAVMLQAETFADEKLALNYLLQQRDAASDPKLRDMLDKRVVRLQGLVTLRQAQRRFEAENGVLTRLEQLVEAGLLPALPDDPLRLGYELREGTIILKKLKIAGMEDQS
ncbi:hypothetical protein [Pseudomonas sp.]|uniref:hypothetical protein n=1 Tax=Pseudomonas sp. TaxID=306 RepID=UPI0027322434|nr:hypothetical protein [Pseudomonas sp.]MDP2244450.1 hypothetical protein [Pseudomonas sp.]